MTGKPWGKFYWADWLADPKLKLCSLEAQGLWIRMLCIAAEAKPLGYVVLEGNALGAADLSLECGKPLRVVQAALAELHKWGVFSTDRQGRIYSRRMVKDVKKAKTAVKNGKNGGNPALRKDKGIPGSDNPHLKAQKPEARSQKKNPPAPPLGGPNSSIFDEAWDAYHTAALGSRGKEQAWRWWPAAAERAGGESRLLAAVRAHVARLAASPRQTPMAFHRWLREGGFEAYLGGSSPVVQRRWQGPPDVWDLVAAEQTPSFANTWLADCRWSDIPKAIIGGPTSIKRLRDEVGPALADQGIELQEQAA